tara:strand:- start:503 stop:874 length:372 start_codon:yes stop_codon:yes gene_type:complete
MQPTFSRPEVHKKGWGEEIWITNNSQYCGKILRFNKDASFSMHYHILKEETWYLAKGKMALSYYNLENADKLGRIIIAGDVVHIQPNIPHKLTALEESEVIEVSTEHFEQDSYRVEKGDSQKE